MNFINYKKMTENDNQPLCLRNELTYIKVFKEKMKMTPGEYTTKCRQELKQNEKKVKHCMREGNSVIRRSKHTLPLLSLDKGFIFK